RPYRDARSAQRDPCALSRERAPLLRRDRLRRRARRMGDDGAAGPLPQVAVEPAVGDLARLGRRFRQRLDVAAHHDEPQRIRGRFRDRDGGRHPARPAHRLIPARRLPIQWSPRRTERDAERRPHPAHHPRRGDRLRAKVVVVFLSAFFSVVVTTFTGVSTTAARHLDITRSFGGSRWLAFRTVVLPSTFPFILSGTRIGLGRALVGVVSAEIISANQGLGFYISLYGTFLD